MTNIKEPIAIVGISCRFPGANDQNSYWDLLINGRSGLSDIPDNRIRRSTELDAETEIPTKGGLVDNFDQFDPTFFGIAPKMAENMDPQQRIILELTWEALEDARIIPDNIKGSNTGVYMGASGNYFSTLVWNLDKTPPYSGTGSINSILANRISYLLDLNGPSYSLNAACSSSLLAIHQACHSIWQESSDLAIAGGIQMTYLPGITDSHLNSSLITSADVTRPFDNRADGYLRSEGGGVLILKPLSKAKEDGDDIYALINGSAVNHNGKSNGLSAPNPKAQETVIKNAWKDAGVDSTSSMGYIEAHGIGAQIADALELKSIGKIHNENHDPESDCYVGSVKSNLGHLEAASGMASIIKVALLLKNGIIPSTIHYEQPNAMVNLEKLNLDIPIEPVEWPQDKSHAGVSSFSFGGINVHMVMERWEQVERSNDIGVPNILTISAKSERSLRMRAQQVIDLLNNEEISLDSICYNFNTGKPGYSWRYAIHASNKNGLTSTLKKILENDVETDTNWAKAPKRTPGVIYRFERESINLIDLHHCLTSFAGYRKSIEEVEVMLQNITGKEFSRIEDWPEQVRNFGIEYCMGILWKQWGILPKAFSGGVSSIFTIAVLSEIISMEVAIEQIIKDELPNQEQLAPSNIPCYELKNGHFNHVDLSKEEDWQSIFNGYVSETAFNGIDIPTKFPMQLNVLNKNLDSMIEHLAQLFVQGAQINWNSYYSNQKYSRITLPSYPFDRQRYWPQPLDEKTVHSGVDPETLLNQLRSSGQFSDEQLKLIQQYAGEALTSSNGSSSIVSNSELIHEKSATQKILELSEIDQKEFMLNYLLDTTSSIIKTDRNELTEDTSLYHIGMDSLMAIELRERIGKELDIEADVDLILGEGTIREIAIALIEAINVKKPTSQSNGHNFEKDSSTDEQRNLLDNIDMLSEEEVNELLRKMES